MSRAEGLTRSTRVDRLFEDWKKATETVDMHLNTSANGSSTVSNGSSREASAVAANSKPSKTPRQRSPIQSWLFPTDADLADANDGAEIPSLTGRRWVDANLNEEQKVSSLSLCSSTLIIRLTEIRPRTLSNRYFGQNIKRRYLLVDLPELERPRHSSKLSSKSSKVSSTVAQVCSVSTTYLSTL